MEIGTIVPHRLNILQLISCHHRSDLNMMARVASPGCVDVIEMLIVIHTLEAKVLGHAIQMDMCKYPIQYFSAVTAISVFLHHQY